MRPLERWIYPPRVDDPEEALRARITHWILFSTIGSLVVLIAFLPIVESDTWFALAIYEGSLAAAMASFALLHSGRIRAAGALFTGLALVLTVVAAFAVGGIQSPQLATAVLVIVVTGFLVSTRAGIWMAVATSLSTLALVVGEQARVIPEPFIEVSPYTTWAALTVVIALSAVFLHVFVGAITASRRDASEKSLRLEEEMQRRAEAEASLHRAEKLEALGRLTGGIAHDFNNILTVLLAGSQMLERRAKAGTPLGPEDLEEIVEIRTSAERAAGLTGQLLAFSRQRVGSPSVVDPNAAIERLRPMLSRLVREEIELEIGPLAAVGCVSIDASRFEQIVMNLVLNAHDALSGRGKICVFTESMEIDRAMAERRVDAALGPHVVLGVSDTGIGIDGDDLDRIFDPFFTTKEKAKSPGTGLGLASVHGVVAAAGGTISVESVVGRGTCFRIYLPQTAKLDRAEPLHTERDRRIAKRIVLMCEDDAAVRRVVRRMLDESELEVLEASSPERAIEIARNHREPIDLLLSDVIMPGMNGCELSEVIREIHPGIGILLVSGYASNLIDQAGLGERSAFLEKPFTPDDLVDRLQALLPD